MISSTISRRWRNLASPRHCLTMIDGMPFLWRLGRRIEFEEARHGEEGADPLLVRDRRRAADAVHSKPVSAAHQVDADPVQPFREPPRRRQNQRGGDNAEPDPGY